MSIQCELNGVTYPSVAAAARAQGRSVDALGKAVRAGRPAPTLFEWEGVSYRSQAAAARALGITWQVMKGRVRRARREAARGGGEARPRCRACTLNGVEYESLVAAGRALGITPPAVHKRLDYARIKAARQAARAAERERDAAAARARQEAPSRLDAPPLPEVAPEPSEVALAPAVLAGVAHPKWSPAADHALVAARGRRDDFHAIARQLGRDPRAVEQRWHRLRVIPDVATVLVSAGLTTRPYPLAGEAA